MTEVFIWALAALFFAVTCVAVWFFLKLFFRFALVILAVFFLIAFLYRFQLLPESVSKRIEEAYFRVQQTVSERVEEKKQQKKETHRRAENSSVDGCDFVFC